MRAKRVDDRLISQRKHAFRADHALTPPRVLTSDGEIIAGAYRRDDVPAGALVGLPVSAGTIEGRAGRRGVEHATRLIQDGQRIRVHGTDGYVEILRFSKCENSYEHLPIRA